MIELIKSALGALARWALAGFIPSAVGLVVVLFVYASSFGKWTSVTSGLDATTLLAATAVFGLAVVTASVLIAFLLLPVYRVLEGYLLPTKLKRPLRSRQLRQWHRLRLISELELPLPDSRLHLERLDYYPEDPNDILPTRLGNALKRLELYGSSRFGLDNQSMWYELLSVAPQDLRKDCEDTRTQVDFFVSSIVSLTLVAATSFIIATQSTSRLGYLVAVASAVLIPLAYKAAVLFVLEYRYAVQAVVNTGRIPLATSLGLEMPAELGTEREMWQAFVTLVAYQEAIHQPEVLNRHRKGHHPQSRRSTHHAPPRTPSRTRWQSTSRQGQASAVPGSGRGPR